MSEGSGGWWNVEDTNWLVAVGSFVAGILGLRGWDRARGDDDKAVTSNYDEKLLKATLAISEAVREEHSKTRHVIHEAARETDRALQAVATSQARMEGAAAAHDRHHHDK